MAQYTGVVASLVYPSALDALWITVQLSPGLMLDFLQILSAQLPFGFCLLRKLVMNISP